MMEARQAYQAACARMSVFKAQVHSDLMQIEDMYRADAEKKIKAYLGLYTKLNKR